MNLYQAFWMVKSNQNSLFRLHNIYYLHEKSLHFINKNTIKYITSTKKTTRLIQRKLENLFEIELFVKIYLRSNEGHELNIIFIKDYFKMLSTWEFF